MSLRQIIHDKLQRSLRCSLLEIINESHLHGGHNGFDGFGESHFRIIISSLELSKLPLVKAHQKIYSILSQEMQQIHALAIEVKSLSGR
jgi:BolA family transcriptional regulator, general stress-responsive regulator